MFVFVCSWQVAPKEEEEEEEEGEEGSEEVIVAFYCTVFLGGRGRRLFQFCFFTHVCIKNTVVHKCPNITLRKSNFHM